MLDKKPIVMKGIVVSDVMDKTIVVMVSTLKTHSKYLKKFVCTKKYKVHDAGNKYVIGDKVVFKGCRPISKDKRFIVLEK